MSTEIIPELIPKTKINVKNIRINVHYHSKIYPYDKDAIYDRLQYFIDNYHYVNLHECTVDNYNNIPACILNFTGKFNNIKKICSISAVWEYNFEMNMFSDKPIFYVGINKCIEQDNEWFILDDNNEIDLFRHSERHTYPYNMDNMIGDYFDKLYYTDVSENIIVNFYKQYLGIRFIEATLSTKISVTHVLSTVFEYLEHFTWIKKTASAIWVLENEYSDSDNHSDNHSHNHSDNIEHTPFIKVPKIDKNIYCINNVWRNY
jgi:hypothetical protein